MLPHQEFAEKELFQLDWLISGRDHLVQRGCLSNPILLENHNVVELTVSKKKYYNCNFQTNCHENWAKVITYKTDLIYFVKFSTYTLKSNNTHNMINLKNFL